MSRIMVKRSVTTSPKPRGVGSGRQTPSSRRTTAVEVIVPPAPVISGAPTRLPNLNVLKPKLPKKKPVKPVGPALALSGGAAHGDFEVGVVQYLYQHGLKPKIICGTSVGAINGLKLAEGEPDRLLAA